MKSSGYTPGKQSQSGTRLDRPPDHARLVQLLNSAQRTQDRHYRLSWPIGKESGRYTLSVIIYGPQQRTSWNLEQKLQVVGEPEWCLQKESENERSELWTVRTGDIALLLSLITSEHEGAAPTENRENNGEERANQSSTGQTAAYSQAQPRIQQANTGSTPTYVQPQPLEQATVGQLSLSGNLKDVDLPSVMQSITLCKMTGKLIVYESPNEVELYFTDGTLVHAHMGHALQEEKTSVGDEVLLELFTWTEGNFQFQHGWNAPERTVKRKMHALIMEGATLQDYRDALAKKNLEPASILGRDAKVQNITETDFDKRLKDGIPTHLDLQKQVFVALAKPLPFQALLEQISMTRTLWIPVLFNLVTLDLVTVSSATREEVAETKAFEGMSGLMTGAYRSLLQPDSGMFSYPMFLYSTNNELTRCQQGGPPFAVVMVEFNQGARGLSSEAMFKIAACFDSIKRPYDILSYSIPNNFFLLLPQSGKQSARDQVRRFFEVLAQTQLDPIVHGTELDTKCGIALAPDDAADLPALLKCVSRLRRAANSDNRIITSG